jgi:hypothetical protein
MVTKMTWLHEARKISFVVSHLENLNQKPNFLRRICAKTHLYSEVEFKKFSWGGYPDRQFKGRGEAPERAETEQGREY